MSSQATMTKISKKNCVEILCIGTELLLGEIINSNAKWLAEELAILGLPHYRQSVVGDNIDRLKEIIQEASKRNRILITTGGLGPTPDDITTEAIAAAFDTPLEERPEIWEEIQKKLSSLGNSPAICNRKQALLPQGAQILPNSAGTAPGMIWSPTNDFTLITFPGVPSELKKMWTETAVPWFQTHLNIQDKFVSRVLRFTGITESVLAEKVHDLLTSSNPTVAPYAGLGEVRLRITAKGETERKAIQILDPYEAELRQRTGLQCYGSDEESLASVVLKLLREKGQTLAVAESCTGGGLGASLTAIPGASDVFIGGVIAYSNSIKQSMLGVSRDLLVRHGAVSLPVVSVMAEQTRIRFKANWSIAISGLAGPENNSESKPVGLVYLAIAGPDGCESHQENFSQTQGRVNIQKLSVVRGLDRLRLLLLSQG